MAPRSTASNVTRRLVGRLQREVQGLPSAARTGLNSTRLRASPLSERLPAKTMADIAGQVSLLSSFRVTNDDRLRMLHVVIRDLERRLAGSDIALHVIDASPEPYRGPVRRLFQDVALPVRFEQRELPLTHAYSRLLSGCETPYFALQFDDLITAGLSPVLLGASCAIVGAGAPALRVVSVPWPVAVRVEDDGRELVVEGYRELHPRSRRPVYQFGNAAPVELIEDFRIDGHRFGVFENFLYGFYFNHLVAAVDDYARRLAWYRRHISDTSVHQIELATSRRARGPGWSHVAVCLDGVALVDLDYAHTEAAVRANSSDLRERVEALEAGARIVVAPARPASGSVGDP